MKKTEFQKHVDGEERFGRRVHRVLYGLLVVGILTLIILSYFEK